ncbi:hypothetical protein [Pseudonocardia acidicola]|uniref:SPW repeat-containing protein n=1 Tax=Pseudonocardia acidicola TaxID=2724939 RepID=A0ABX1SHI9_9PSEU|nr:hypothetical protein [Pseudonocardia acidicola]NMI00546.1 hypothetical protein [Pseudonocardia acidicola]
MAAAYLPVIGGYWLSLVAIVAFAIAGSRVGTARATHLHGACAALGSYLLVLPLVLWLPTGHTGVGVPQILTTAVAAVAVGAIAGIFAGRRRDATAAGA